jgi:uncharacterized SAM-binding protein YcdF (DUF218 family)
MIDTKQLDEFCRDLNTISAWLALDDFSSQPPNAQTLSELDAIVLLGNQLVATLTAACQLALQFPQAKLVFSGGVGHSTGLLLENLRRSEYGELACSGAIRPAMAEAEMYAIVAQKAFALPAERILIENRSANSGENARFSLMALSTAHRAKGTHLLLQDPTMQRRSVLTWQREAQEAKIASLVVSHAVFLPQVEAGANGLPQFTKESAGNWTMERYIGLLLGEIHRLHDNEDGYGPRGKNYLPHVEIPSAVWRSYQRAIARNGEMLAIR